MFLSLRNLGMIKTADIEINAITVIAGENNTGKNTVGKTLFCILNSFYEIDNKIEEDRISDIVFRISRAYIDAKGSINSFDIVKLAKSIIANKNMYIDAGHELQQCIEEFLIEEEPIFKKYIKKGKFDYVADDIIRILDIPNNEIMFTVLHNKMQAEFDMQINNVFDETGMSEITLGINDTEVKIQVKNNEEIEISDYLNLNAGVVYIDDPYALESLSPSDSHISTIFSFSNHREHLIACLEDRKRTSDVIEIIASKKLDKVLEILYSVCTGKMVKRSNSSFVYMEDRPDKMIDIVNVSTGLKTFAIIKTLLVNGWLEENGTIIFHKPEIHLHPEWQLVLAELIVLIQKVFNMHILLNTHSPYFLDAIEVYSHKHGIADKCKYYLAEASGTMSVITDVSENIELIYAKLARPLQVLENERNSYE